MLLLPGAALALAWSCVARLVQCCRAATLAPNAQCNPVPYWYTAPMDHLPPQVVMSFKNSGDMGTLAIGKAYASVPAAHQVRALNRSNDISTGLPCCRRCCCCCCAVVPSHLPPTPPR